ncbi:Pv-fam-g protein [Plasmodium vivax North Korean]|uniref:Pv-fam-g protein n=1 Tax=Plasmodium vivax North Korean TaxID=1035514 RepID=A0A0J9WAX3_PLAVI|nr:Pv-fam-g protein [Plasmodium vivax North Korean]
MEVDKIRRSSVRRHRLSSADATCYKPTAKSSLNNETCSDEGEIEFEGWVEFITKNEKEDNDDDDTLCEEKIGKSYGKRRSTVHISSSPGVYTHGGKAKKGEKYVKGGETTIANANVVVKNEEKSDYAYTNTNYMNKEPVVTLNNGVVYANGNNATTYPLIINTQEKTNNAMNVLNPNYVDPSPPVVLKNQQIIPQLYIRQPPTVVVTNEPRPPLVINPPPANIVFKNKAPQPIYVNSTRPNIIIKNDPAVMQNPLDMDSTPIQLDLPMENASTTMTESIKYPCTVNMKNEPMGDNRSCFYKANVNATTSGVMPATNVIQLDNSLGGPISQQILPNVYMMNENGQLQGGFQTQQGPIYTVSPMGNLIQAQQSPSTTYNSYEPNVFQCVQPSYAQVMGAQSEQCSGGGILLNQPLQMAPQQHVQAMSGQQHVQAMSTQQHVQGMPTQHMQAASQPQVHLTGGMQNYQAYGSAQPALTYEKFCTQQVAQPAYGNAAPQYVHQSYMQTNPIMQEQMVPQVAPRRSSFVPNNNLAQGGQPVMRYSNNLGQPVNVNKFPLQHQASSASSEFLPSCGPVGCAASNNKPVQTPNVRRNSYVNPQAQGMMQPLPKKVQIVARPMHDQNFRGYN